MKKQLLLALFIGYSTFAQIPTGYYDSATGTGYALKTQLHNIITNHTDLDYSGLWITYETSDRDIYFENNNTILDMYSENPSGSDPYEYNYGSNQCGTYANEGDCYNREHIIPQSVFNELSPMRNDAHFVVPTDGKVNGLRSNFPHGVVGTASTTSLNGSKLGSASNTGYAAGYTGTVFEPIDEFKGDVARMYFYFATRYENSITSWGVAYPMFNGTTNQVFTDTFLNILLQWHNQDPVSQKEIDRNNAIYIRQNNRNPFIDFPQYANQIWSNSPDTEAPTAPLNVVASNNTNTTIQLNWTASTDNVGITSYLIYADGSLLTTSVTNSIVLTGLTQNTSYDFVVYATDAAGNTSAASNTVTTSTTNIIDVEAPTIPLNLVASNESHSSVSLSWTAATDNVGVIGYSIYQDNVFILTVVGTSANITGLTAETTYSFTVTALDEANNESAQSNAVTATTLAVPVYCASESFANIPASSSNYATRTWIGDNGLQWTATDARTDQTLNSSAITIRNGTLTAPEVGNGITDLTITTQLVFSGTSDTFNLLVNDVFIDEIPYSATAQTTTISGINVAGNVTIKLVQNNNSNRVSIDDLSWTCFGGSTDTESPGDITDLAASNTQSNSTYLTWTASTDNVGVTGYTIYQDGVSIGTTATNAFTVNGLSPNTSYSFTVQAFDAAGNTSSQSNAVNITTLNEPIAVSELFISEYVEGSSNNKAIEIANFTGETVNLSAYTIKKQVNGAGSWQNILQLNGTITNSDVFVIANSSSAAAILNVADQTSGAPIDFNGNDPVGLFKNDVLIDIVGTFNGGSTNFAINTTLRRKNTISSPNTTYTVNEWDSFSQDTFDGLGTHSLASLDVTEYVPNLFSVYPNPAPSNTIMIAINENRPIDSIQIFSITGQLILEQIEKHNEVHQLKIDNIPSGVYFIKVISENNYSTKQVLVK
jgi:endonuclease I/chitodextrinase